MRKERDSLGELEVPEDLLYGALMRTSRLVMSRWPKEVIHAFAILKKAAAGVNAELGLLPPKGC